MSKYPKTNEVGEVVTLKGTNRKFLLLSTAWESKSNTIASMVMLGEIKMWWLDDCYDGVCAHAYLMDNPQTAFGACPANFAIELCNK